MKYIFYLLFSFFCVSISFLDNVLDSSIDIEFVEHSEIDEVEDYKLQILAEEDINHFLQQEEISYNCNFHLFYHREILSPPPELIA